MKIHKTALLLVTITATLLALPSLANAQECSDGQVITGVEASVSTEADRLAGEKATAPRSVVGQPIYLDLTPQVFFDFQAPEIVWTARLRGSDKTVKGRAPVDEGSLPTLVPDQTGTWEITASFTYISCLGYTDNKGNQYSDKLISYTTAPVAVEVIKGEKATVKATLYKYSKSLGFSDPSHKYPTILQIVSPYFTAKIDCGREGMAPALPLKWKVYFASKRPSNKGKAQLTWTSRPTGCVSPDGDGYETDLSLKSESYDCPPKNLVCARVLKETDMLEVEKYRSGAVLMELTQGDELVAAFRFRYRAYINIKNPAKDADGPFTFVSIKKDGRCEGMPDRRCSSYKTENIKKKG